MKQANIKSSILEQISLQHERGFLWLPAFLSFGIALYFSLMSEPQLGAGACALTVALILFWVVRSHATAKIFFLLVIFIVAGFFAAQIRTAISYTPFILKKLEPVMVTGTIESLEDLEEGKGTRVILSNPEIEGVPPLETPRKIRLSIRKDENLRLGQRVSVLAGLNPPSPPVMPGSFDFQRYMYFQGIGALGFAYTQPEILSEREPGNFSRFIENIRTQIDQAIDASLSKGEAPIAKALITGKRGSIDKDDDQAVKDAGLYHILSISGLHITLFATIVFFTTRFLMACVPSFALRHPIKKYAAVLGFLAAIFYTLLSGGEIPALRSLIMLGAAFLAIVLDRDPLSPRLIAFAALAVLLAAPESLLSISFQMSFAAVAAMIFFYDWQRDRISKWYSQAGMIGKIGLYFGGIAMTTILATLATAPFTIFHFQSLQLYGVISNALVIPMTGFIIMPFAAIALLLMPFGAASAPLQLVGFGVELMLKISYFVAGLPHATLHFSSWPASAFILIVSAALFFVLWRGRLKWIAVFPLVYAFFLIALYRQPDILISSKFTVAAVRGDQALHISSKRKEKFVRENWERMTGFMPGTAQSWSKEGMEDGISCDLTACRLERYGHKISFIKKAGSAAEECAWADMALSFEPLEIECSAYLIDKFDASRNGAYAIWLHGEKPVIKTVQEGRGNRPWSKIKNN